MQTNAHVHCQQRDLQLPAKRLWKCGVSAPKNTCVDRSPKQSFNIWQNPASWQVVLWCSGYHVCFTRRRSRVRTSPEPPFFSFFFFSPLWFSPSPFSCPQPRLVSFQYFILPFSSFPHVLLFFSISFCLYPTSPSFIYTYIFFFMWVCVCARAHAHAFFVALFPFSPSPDSSWIWIFVLTNLIRVLSGQTCVD